MFSLLNLGSIHKEEEEEQGESETTLKQTKSWIPNPEIKTTKISVFLPGVLWL